MAFLKMAAAAASAAVTGAKFGKGLATNVFKKTASTARQVFNASSVKNDVLMKGASFTRDAASSFSRERVISSRLKRAANAKPGPKVSIPKTIRPQPSLSRTTSYVVGASALAVGTAGMMAVGVMNGMNNAAKDILLERYMQDQRYSRNMLLQSRVGLSMGTSNLNRYGSTTGLSNSLHRTRHGASY